MTVPAPLRSGGNSIKMVVKDEKTETKKEPEVEIECSPNYFQVVDNYLDDQFVGEKKPMRWP